MTEATEKTGRYTKKVRKFDGRGQVYDEYETLSIWSIARDVFSAIFAIILAFSSFFTIGEGERGVVTKFGEALYIVDPGLHFKIPFVNSVKKIEVRERRSVEDLAAATGDRLPVSAQVSINWTVQPGGVMDVYKEYGSLSQFQERILDPKLREAAKAAIGKTDAGKLIRERQTATAEIMKILVELMAGYPITINSPQIENVSLPQAYLDAVLAKERAREDAAREQYNLEKQALTAQQTVQTAEAERDAAMAAADGQAYRTRTEAEADADATRLRKAAEAEGIREVERALSENPLFIEYTRAIQWNGQMPQTVLGDSGNVLLGLGPK